ncbi:NAD-binding protein [Streptomyces lunaelactis]|uniref:NAD(P)-binding domain-containing protein n=1 Tax=Streptomyces lunaelactis TaxID=1535768 RepID=UPI001584AECA|nr:NAD(P)-binding domain-containing protein [Streptomyces lunaelactis]NUK06620.1 NAD-binding protein [Streptomyces lunaelactis]NUK33463.1 NAD-binding protein [Streptomyces lunaelactis]NUK39915.1 NAD-binding protein [Streptomyces lunaelactis]NUK56277.1 NAD-binding protein [Streptomyces lunaelactis]NUK90857.1 NAD-binding protein [Streptomyces lunaelactis]
MAETPRFRVILRMEIQSGTQDEFERTWWEVGSAIARQPANRGQTLTRATEGDTPVYYVITDWTDESAFRTFEVSEAHVEHRRRLGKYRTSGEMTTTQTVFDIPPSPGPGAVPGPRAVPATPAAGRDRTPLAFIGLGNMGGGMAHALLGSGRDLTVYNRTAAKARVLVDAGATAAESPAAAAAGHSVVLLSLSDEAAVDDVLFGQIVPVLAPGSIVVDTSTVSPAYARTAAIRLADAGLRRVEACVVGNPIQAREGKLRVYTSGAEQDVAEVAGILDTIGSEVLHLGAPGAATTLKLIFNLLLGAQVASLSEAVAYGVRTGLDRDQLLSAIAGSGFSSIVMRFRAELMRKGSYEPAFFRSALMEKDLRLAIDDATGAGVELPVLDTVRAGFAAVVAAGDGDKDASVLIEHTTAASSHGAAS